MPDEQVRYYRRTVSDRTTEDAVIYAVRITGDRQDPVPALGSFPPPWAPTPLPGQLLATNDGGGPIIAPCLVPRSQFRHYTEVPALQAAMGWPELVHATGWASTETPQGPG